MPEGCRGAVISGMVGRRRGLPVPASGEPLFFEAMVTGSPMSALPPKAAAQVECLLFIQKRTCRPRVQFYCQSGDLGTVTRLLQP
jgi:hypothetical protein